MKQVTYSSILITWHIFPISLIFPNSNRTPMVGSKFTVFRLVLLCIWGQFSKYKPPGDLYLEGWFNVGFLRYQFGGLIHGGAYFRNFTKRGDEWSLQKFALRACEQLQKVGQHEQASSRLNFASKSSKGKILLAVKNFNGPFITPTKTKTKTENGKTKIEKSKQNWKVKRNK